MIAAPKELFQRVVDGLVHRHPHLVSFNVSDLIMRVRENWAESVQNSPVFPGGIVAHCKEGPGISGGLDKLENHRKYLDIHVLLDGAEQLYWERAQEDFLHSPYVPGDDVEWYFPKEPLKLDLDKRIIVLIEPGYPHRTLCPVSSTAFLQKIVFKVPAGTDYCSMV